MQYTRKQIIDYISTHQTATVSELSHQLSLTITNIRHHVKELESQHVLEEIGTLPGDGRGRPTKLYALSKGIQVHNTFELSTVLLKLLKKNGKRSGRNDQELFQSIAEELIGAYEQHPTQIQRLNRAIQWLNEHNYRARWEASAIGPKMIFEHCPYRVVQEQFPEICQLGVALISKLTGFDPQFINFQRLESPGTTQCLFELR